MGDSLEVRISTVEHIQEEFRHDIQEMERQLARLTKLIEGHTGIGPENTYGSPSFPLQPILSPLIHQRLPSCESRIPVRGNVPPRVHHPNWQSHVPTDNHSSFWEGVPISWSCEQFREQLRKAKRKSRKEEIGSYSSHIHRVTSPTTSEATCCIVMCAST